MPVILFTPSGMVGEEKLLLWCGKKGKFWNSEKLKFRFLFITVARKSYIH